MPTRNVVLTDRQEALIEALVQSGRYQNASEVMREGLRLVVGGPGGALSREPVPGCAPGEDRAIRAQDLDGRLGPRRP